MTIKLMDIDAFRNLLCTLQEASTPNSVEDEIRKESVTNSTIIAINFDNVTSVYAKKLGKVPTSSDVLYQHKGKDIYFVEFKSSKPTGQIREELKLKATESLLTFMELTKTDRDYARNHMTFVVVFREQEKSERERHHNMQLKRGKQPATKGLKLGRLKGMYFKDVLTQSSNEFEDYITQQGWTSMA